jgi:hypothetical protein
MTARAYASVWGTVAERIEHAMQDDWQQGDELLLQWANSKDPDEAYIGAWWKEHREGVLDRRAKGWR